MSGHSFTRRLINQERLRRFFRISTPSSHSAMDSPSPRLRRNRCDCPSYVAAYLTVWVTAPKLPSNPGPERRLGAAHGIRGGIEVAVLFRAQHIRRIFHRSQRIFTESSFRTVTNRFGILILVRLTDTNSVRATTHGKSDQMVSPDDGIITVTVIDLIRFS